jgi:hypothetical protein
VAVDMNGVVIVTLTREFILPQGSG